jgi:hypothetical protein
MNAIIPGLKKEAELVFTTPWCSLENTGIRPFMLFPEEFPQEINLGP